MKICICSSLTFADEVLEIGKMLEARGHEVLLPNGIINRLAEQPNFDPVRAKIETKSNRLHAEKIRECDIVLMCNFLKNCTPGYIGANCFAELYFANYFEKPIFTLFPLPDIAYINDEIRSMGITVLNNDLNLLPPESNFTAGASAPTPPTNPVAPAAPTSSVVSPTSLSDSSSAAPTIPTAPIPADPSALPPNPAAMAANMQTAPITSESVHCDVPASNSRNPLKQVRDNWFSLWNKPKSEE